MTQNTDSATIDGIDFHIGQKWRENDSRFERIVTVTGWDILTHSVQIKFVRKTWARAARFNGSGYKLVSQSVERSKARETT